MLHTMPPSSLIISLSKQRTSWYSREMSKPSPLNHHENSLASSSKYLVPSSWLPTTKRRRKPRSGLPRTLRSTLQKGGASLVKYDSIKNKRVKRSVSRISVKKEFVPSFKSHNPSLYALSRMISSCAESCTNCSILKKLSKPTPGTFRRNHGLLQDCVQSSNNMTRRWKMLVLIKLEHVLLSSAKKRK